MIFPSHRGACRSSSRSAEARASQRREGFLEAARTGIAFVRGSGELRAVFSRGVCFFVPGIAMGTLLPVVGRFELKLDEFSFGVLYAVFGVGALAFAAGTLGGGDIAVCRVTSGAGSPP